MPHVTARPRAWPAALARGLHRQDDQTVRQSAGWSRRRERSVQGAKQAVKTGHGPGERRAMQRGGRDYVGHGVDAPRPDRSETRPIEKVTELASREQP